MKAKIYTQTALSLSFYIGWKGDGPKFTLEDNKKAYCPDPILPIDKDIWDKLVKVERKLLIPENWVLAKGVTPINKLIKEKNNGLHLKR